MSAERASRVSDIHEFLEEVVDTLRDRPALDDPEVAVAWLGDVGAVVSGEDADAKRRLASKLISLGLPERVEDTEELVELVARTTGRAIAEMNAVVASLDSALVSFDEQAVTRDGLASAAEGMHDALAEGNEGLVEATAAFLAGAVLADPRPYGVPEAEMSTAIEAVEEGLRYAQGLHLPAGAPGEHLHGILLCAENVETPDEASFVPDGDTLIHHRWGRVAGHAAELLTWEPFTELDPPSSANAQLERAVHEAAFLLAASPMFHVPILFDHARAAGSVRTQAHELTSRWLDRALGYWDEDEPEGVIRTVDDLRVQRGLLVQALIGVFCSSG